MAITSQGSNNETHQLNIQASSICYLIWKCTRHVAIDGEVLFYKYSRNLNPLHPYKENLIQILIQKSLKLVQSIQKYSS